MSTLTKVELQAEIERLNRCVEVSERRRIRENRYDRDQARYLIKQNRRLRELLAAADTNNTLATQIQGIAESLMEAVDNHKLDYSQLWDIEASIREVDKVDQVA